MAAMIVHGTTVSVDGAGLLLTGRSGSGKSVLAIQMIGLGAMLVADDSTEIGFPDDGAPVASPPQQIAGLIEARGVGLLRAPQATVVRLAAVVDMNANETERLPQRRTMQLGDRSLELLHRVDAPWFAAAMMLYLRAGRFDA